MKSIKRRYEAQAEKHPALSSYMNFAGAVRGQKLSNDMVRRWFNTLVDPEDYDPEDKRDLLQFLYAISKGTRGQPGLGVKMPEKAVVIPSTRIASSEVLLST